MLIDTRKLDEAFEDALQLPARTYSERFDRTLSVSNVKYFYEISCGQSPTVPENLKKVFDECMSDAEEIGV